MVSMPVQWSHEPDPHDYPAAVNYLTLITSPAKAMAIAERLRLAPITIFKAKDILRAADLPLLKPKNPHVAADLKKIRAGEDLSPVLLVRGDLDRGIRAQIADGYHRVCASFHVDENTDIPAQLVDITDVDSTDVDSTDGSAL